MRKRMCYKYTQMVRQKITGWKKWTVAAAALALFVVATVWVATPKVLAAATYNWKSADPPVIHATSYPTGKATFDLQCSPSNTGPSPEYTCQGDNGEQCPLILKVDGTDISTAQVMKTQYSPVSNACPIQGTAGTVSIGSVDNGPGGSAAAGGGSAANDGSDDPQLQCGTPLNPLNWFLCPIVKGINVMVNSLDNAITGLLTVQQEKIFDTSTDTGKGYYSAWQTFRLFALALLVIAALTMIIAQALGFEVLDAYSMKKIAPRLIFAIIGIALSWELMKFAVLFTNDLGNGIRQVIYYPFRNIGGDLALGGGATVAVTLIGGGAILALSLVGLLSFALTAILAVLIAFLVLIIRQLVIVVLILVAPIAIACFILPNTQGVYKLWSESFMKALMMFPIIVAFLAVGRVFAVTTIGGNISNASAISQLIGFAAYFMPYFLIPYTFRFAGGAMRTIGGSINDRNRGAFDRLKKYRGAKVQQNMEAMKHGTRYRENNILAKGFNATTGTMALLPSAGLDPTKARSRYTAAKAQQVLQEAEELRTKNPDFVSNAQDDRILETAQTERGRDAIRKHLQTKYDITDAAELDTAVGVVERLQHSGSSEAVEAAIALQRFATGTGYNDKDGNFDAQEAMQSLFKASHGNRALAGGLVGQSKGVATQAGQVGFGGASFGKLNGEMSKLYNGADEVDADGIAIDAFESNDAVTVSRARPAHVRFMTQAVNKRVDTLQAGPQPRVAGKPAEVGELGRLSAQMQNFSESASMYAAPNRQTEITKHGATAAQYSKELETQYQAYMAAHNAAARDASLPRPPEPSRDLQAFMQFRNARAGNPHDPAMQQEEK